MTKKTFAIKVRMHRGKDVVTHRRFTSRKEAEKWAKWNYYKSVLSNGELSSTIKIIEVNYA